MAHSRRDFLKGAIGTISLSMAVPGYMLSSPLSSAYAQDVLANAAAPGKTLVVVEFDGGNDGLNTVIPYADKAYYDARPTLAIPNSSVLKVNDKLGFHPAMTKFKALFDQGHIAVVQNTGYPNPDLSHFRSRIIYQRADPTTQETIDQLGWLGKYADLELFKTNNGLAAINFGVSLNKSLAADKVIVPSISNFSLYQFNSDPKYLGDRNNQLNAFKKAGGVQSPDNQFDYVGGTGVGAVNGADTLQNGIKKYTTPNVTYIKDTLGQQLQMAAQVIAADLGTQIIYVFVGGFDTHTDQLEDQAKLLGSISDNFDAFYQDLVRLNKVNDVMLLGFSEFGRRVNENGSGGTDHGTAAPMFVLGNSVKGGFYGDIPNLTKLDSAGNLMYSTDFRSVYNTILTDWLNTDAQAILGGKFDNLGFVNK